MSKDRTKLVNSEIACEEMVAEVRRLYRQHHYVEFHWSEGRQRTLTQNRALHLWCRLLAEQLNDAGFDMKRVIKPEVDIPWTGPSVKEYLWRPVQEALLQKQSTADADRTEYTEVHEVLCRHLGQKLGIRAPEWPRRDREAA